MTLEEAQVKIKELEGIVASKDTELTTSQEKITKLNTENAERRILNTQQKILKTWRSRVFVPHGPGPVSCN